MRVVVAIVLCALLALTSAASVELTAPASYQAEDPAGFLVLFDVGAKASLTVAEYTVVIDDDSVSIKRGGEVVSDGDLAGKDRSIWVASVDGELSVGQGTVETHVKAVAILKNRLVNGVTFAAGSVVSNVEMRDADWNVNEFTAPEYDAKEGYIQFNQPNYLPTVSTSGFEVKFEVMAAKTASIALLPKRTGKSDEAYEVVLGAGAEIRRGTQGRKLIGSKKAVALKPDTFRTFWMRLSEGVLSVGRGKTVGNRVLMRANVPAVSSKTLTLGFSGSRQAPATFRINSQRNIKPTKKLSPKDPKCVALRQRISQAKTASKKMANKANRAKNFVDRSKKALKKAKKSIKIAQRKRASPVFQRKQRVAKGKLIALKAALKRDNGKVQRAFRVLTNGMPQKQIKIEKEALKAWTRVQTARSKLNKVKAGFRLIIKLIPNKPVKRVAKVAVRQAAVKSAQKAAVQAKARVQKAQQANQKAKTATKAAKRNVAPKAHIKAKAQVKVAKAAVTKAKARVVVTKAAVQKANAVVKKTKTVLAQANVAVKFAKAAKAKAPVEKRPAAQNKVVKAVNVQKKATAAVVKAQAVQKKAATKHQAAKVTMKAAEKKVAIAKQAVIKTMPVKKAPAPKAPKQATVVVAHQKAKAVVVKTKVNAKVAVVKAQTNEKKTTRVVQVAKQAVNKASTQLAVAKKAVLQKVQAVKKAPVKAAVIVKAPKAPVQQAATKQAKLIAAAVKIPKPAVQRAVQKLVVAKKVQVKAVVANQQAVKAVNVAKQNRRIQVNLMAQAKQPAIKQAGKAAVVRAVAAIKVAQVQAKKNRCCGPKGCGCRASCDEAIGRPGEGGRAQGPCRCRYQSWCRCEGPSCCRPSRVPRCRPVGCLVGLLEDVRWRCADPPTNDDPGAKDGGPDCAIAACGRGPRFGHGQPGQAGVGRRRCQGCCCRQGCCRAAQRCPTACGRSAQSRSACCSSQGPRHRCCCQEGGTTRGRCQGRCQGCGASGGPGQSCCRCGRRQGSRGRQSRCGHEARRGRPPLLPTLPICLSVCLG